MVAIQHSSRSVAAWALGQVLQKREFAEQALYGHTDFLKLTARDRAFSRLLLASTLRHLGQIDSVLDRFLKKQPPAAVLNHLRLATAQLLILETPPHAAVGETVSLLKSRGNTAGFAKLANAVLRNISREGPGLLRTLPPKLNLPDWLRKSWDGAYGKGATGRMAQTLSMSPPLDISVKQKRDHWAKTLNGTTLGAQTVRLASSGDVRALHGFEDGNWWVQDLAASLPVSLLGDTLQGKKVLDLCAAPGGKTLQLAARGAQVTAVDLSETRLDRLRENLERTGLSATILTADIQTLKLDPEYDIVLLDAPCSATGTFRRHPDVLYNTTASQIPKLASQQRRLLKRAARWVNPGGTLLYCTCSIEPDEGVNQVQPFLQALPDFRLNPILTLSGLTLPADAYLNGSVQTRPDFLPDEGGLDGFFIARFQREGAM